MLVMMMVSLITSRVYLNTLGETDFGIFNIVGGLVLSFSFISNTLQVATQRYLNFEMGKNNLSAVHNVFNVSFIIYWGISLVVISLGETVGLWFLNNRMNIPDERMFAANVVFQLSLLGFVCQMLRIPYNATIIAYEEMSFYAYFSIIEAALKLFAILTVIFLGFDKLILVSLLTAFVYLFITLGYKFYCNKRYQITKFEFNWNKHTASEIAKYSGWSVYGSGAIMCSNQGVDVIINLFWGVTVNAATGIASQMSHAINQLVSNFQVAYNPQLVKLYAQDRIEEYCLLIRRASKGSFCLLLYLFTPFYICSSYILEVWLGFYPAFTEGFVRLMLIYVLLDSLQAPLWLSVLASGEIKQYQLITGSVILLNLPFIYILMYSGFSPLYAWICRIIISLILFVIRLLYLRHKIGFSINKFVNHTLFRSLIVFCLSVIIPYFISVYSIGFHQFLFVFTTNFLAVSICILLVGLTQNERKFVIGIFKSHVI